MGFDHERAGTDFVHLHVHTEFSALDGLSTVSEVLAAIQADGQNAVAMTEHGNCAGHPDLQIACDKAGVKPIFGMEAYFVDDRFDRGESGKKVFDYWHLILWAMDDQGLRNLWAMSTEAYRDGLWGKYPRLDWDTLRRLNTGVMASTACLGGPVLNPYIHGDEDAALANLLRLQEIFGDRLYAEVQPNADPEQVRGNYWLLEQAHRYGIEPVATGDCHYPTPAEKKSHKVWLAAALAKSLEDLADSTMFQGDGDFHMRTGAEMHESLRYLGSREVAEEIGLKDLTYPGEFWERALTNTRVIADRCTAHIETGSHNPVYSRVSEKHPDPAQHDVERLLDWCLTRWTERTEGKTYGPEVYEARFETEFRMIVDKGFAGYFLMVADLVSHAKKNHLLVGPGRGSGGGSLVAYLLGITEIDPVEYDILFERFMTKGRTELPDFDIDFPSAKKWFMFHYTAERWGEAHVATVGTHARLKSKSAIQSIARAIEAELPADHWPQLMECSAIIDAAEGDTAGLGLSWEDLWARAGDQLQPYADKYPRLFELAGQMHGRLKTYGKHPAGVIIDPDHPLTENLPLRQGEGGQMIAQFNLQVLELLGYVKFDLLNISNLDMIQLTVDLIKKHTGRTITPYDWHAELEDPYLYEQIGEGWTLGLFQLGTHLGVEMARRMKPKSLRELADMITLVRPGPRGAHLDDLYLARRAGEEEIEYADPRMADILGNTWGAMIYQEQLMKLCMVLAGYDDVQADKVRKILGKKKVAEAKEQGSIFIERAVANGTDPHVAHSLWMQMEEFAKYSFGYAHAIAYAILAIWTAWFKFHYPLYFLCAALSIVDSDKKPDFIEEARRMGFRVLPPDINLSGKDFSIGDTGLDIRYGLNSIKGLGAVATESILAGQPYESWEDFLARKGPKCNSGHVKLLVRIGALDSLVPNRRWLEKWLEHEAIPGAEKCQHRTGGERDIVWLPSPVKGVPSEPQTVDWTLPCTFDWQSEPDELTEKGRKKKRKAPPKKCTRACRMFSPSAPPEPDSVEPYGKHDIRAIEMDMLKIHLTTTPFDDIPLEERETLSTAADALTGPFGVYAMAVVVQGFNYARTRQDMGFVNLATERGSLSRVVVFSSDYAQHRAHLHTQGQMGLVIVTKNQRGFRLDEFLPLNV